MSRTPALASLVLASTLTLAACGDDSDSGHDGHEGHDMADMTGMTTEDADDGDMGDMHDHAMDGGEAPAGIEDAVNPMYPVGTEVTVLADHMEGMEGATGTVTGAYSTTAYAVSYTPTDGGAPVSDHRWVVQEELENPGDAPLADGTEVTLAADHMSGMEGATATIDSSTQETVYMVDITTDDGMTMTNHKWVTESELAPADAE
ncbi:YdhK family protein [Corynebacterium neomassiliense]|uniref:YdhK family protein n=1 Tax=Corynebacterium neomassiliense TaxID=2079482 RepID=UPI00102F4861|nr:YdhK family protein [Corynebacterium neomassiliense]